MAGATHSKLTAVRPWIFQSPGRLFLSLFLVLAIPTAIMMVLTTVFVSNELKAEAVMQNTVTAHLVAKQLEEEFFGLRRYVESFATRRGIIAALASNDGDALRDDLLEAVEQNSKVTRAIITDTNGVLRFDYPRDPSAAGKDASHRDWFQGVSQSDHPYVSESYQRSAIDQTVVVMIAMHIRDSDGRMLGYLGAQYAIRDLMRWLESVRSRSGDRIAVFDQRGHRLWSFDSRMPPGLSRR